MSGALSTATVGCALVGVSFLVTGVGLLRLRLVPLAASLVGVGGAVALAGVVALTQDQGDVGGRLFWAAFGLFLPLALATYPVPRIRHPVDLVALITLATCGLLPVLAPDPGAVESWGLVSGVTLIAHTWWRLERAGAEERRAVQWAAFTAGTAALLVGVTVFAAESATVLGVSIVLIAATGPAMYFGVRRPDVVDVRALVVRTVVTVVAVVTFMSLFVLVVAGLGSVSSRDPSVGTLALVGGVLAATFHPVQVMLRGVVDLLLFGARPDPLDAASSVAGLVGNDPVVALQAIREALVLPHAALLVDGDLVASSGTVVTQQRRFDLDGVGELVVGLRPGDLDLSTGDKHVLRLVVPLLAQNLRIRALAEEVQEWRERTVAAVQDERRRLRRDLHDGLGPRLSGIAFTADAVRNLLRDDPTQADELLRGLRAETATAIADIRRLVYGMRPPALDELGLVLALRQQTVGLRTRHGAPLRTSILAGDDLPALPAAVEVAAYRIVVEALANVARHTSSASASVRLEASPAGLSVEVRDASGLAEGWAAGVGLSSMRERAAELGGTLEAGPAGGGGRVLALLPY